MADDNTITQPRSRYLTEVADPPPDRRNAFGIAFGRTRAAAEFVRSQEGKWCKIYETSTDGGGSTLTQFKKRFKDCEWVSRKIGKITSIYGRLRKVEDEKIEGGAQ